MKKISHYLNYLILALVLGLGSFYFLDIKKMASKRELAAVVEVKKPINVDEVVNKYIKQTADQMLREQINSQIAIRQQLSRPVVVKKDAVAVEVRPEDIPADQQIWKNSQLNQISTDARNAQAPSAENLKRQEELEKKEFARQYIENARKDGYHVVLSPDLKVLSVTPIRQPSQSSDSVDSFPAD